MAKINRIEIINPFLLHLFLLLCTDMNLVFNFISFSGALRSLKKNCFFPADLFCSKGGCNCLLERVDKSHTYKAENVIFTGTFLAFKTHTQG